MYLVISAAELAVCAYLAWRQILPKVSKKCMGILFWGSLFTAISNACIFAKFEIVPLASAQALSFMASCIMYTILGKLALKEDLNFSKGLSVLLCIAGSGLVVLGLVNSIKLSQKIQSVHSNVQNGTEIVGHHNSTGEVMEKRIPKRNILTTDMYTLLLGLGISILHGMTDVGYGFCSKTLNDQVEDLQVLNFWYLTGSIVFTVLLMFGLEFHKLTLPTELDDIMLLTTHTLTTGIGHMSNFILLKLLSFIELGIIINVEIPMDMLAQYVIASNLQPIKGGMFDIVGTTVILAGLLLPPMGELWNLKCKQKDASEEDVKLLPLESE